jgi:hypothetical protein
LLFSAVKKRELKEMKSFILNIIFFTLLFSTTSANCSLEQDSKRISSTSATGTLLGDIDLLVNKGKCGGDLCNTIKMAVEDSIDNTESITDIGEDAEQILDHFSQNNDFNDESTSDIGLQIRKEKVISTLWHLGTAPRISTSEDSAKLTLETYLISDLSQKTSTYGPGSAAAYTTWFAYKKTCDKGECDPTLALRAGMITGAASLAVAKADGLSTLGYRDSESVKKRIVGGALSGLVIAARGGNERAIRRGIYHSAGFALVRDHYKKITYSDDSVIPNTTTIFCLNTVNPNRSCAATEAYLSFSEEKAQIENLKAINSSERISKTPAEGTAWKPAEIIPPMRSMTLFDGQWRLDVKTQKMSRKNSPTTKPSTLLTYIGAKAQTPTKVSVVSSSHLTGLMQTTRKAIEDLETTQTKKKVFLNGTAAASLLCINGEKSRHIVLEAPSEEPGLACRVIYQQGKTIGVPWTAKYNVDFCRSKAVALTVKKIGQGWSCYAQ